MDAAVLLQGGSEGEDGGAEQAFEALRVQVVAMRQQLELVHRQGEQVRDASTVLTPDYTLTLGKMEKTLGVIAARLTTVEQQPALQMSGAQLRSEMGAATQTASSMMVRAMVEPLEEMRIATAKMEGMVGKARNQVEQRRWLWRTAIGGAVSGALLWVVLAAVLPWGAGDWMAAVPISGGDRWAAGHALLRREGPQTWDRMVRLYKACGDQLTELCEAAIVVRTMPPVGQEGKMSPSAPLLPATRSAPRLPPH